MDLGTKKQIDKILRTPEFDGIVKAYADVIEKWREENVIGNNEFETLKLLFIREGKIAGLKEFINYLENPE
jgi:hypothetical protein